MANINTTSTQVKALLKDVLDTGFNAARADELERLLNPHYQGDSMDPALRSMFSPDELKQILVLKEFSLIQATRVKDNLETEVRTMNWLSESDFSVLGKNDVSRIHKLAESIMADQIFPRSRYISRSTFSEVTQKLLSKPPSIVVRHDWATALGRLNASGDRIEIKLPYDTTMFEFFIGGKCVIVEAFYAEDGDWTFTSYIEFERDKWWYSMEHTADEAFAGLHMTIRKQITAICVALSAKIADKSNVQAPTALNKRRSKTGKPLLKTYHVVDLSALYRSKAKNSPSNNERSSPRLHWRMGHWRRNPGKSPIWIDWMLVGNVDLGFIDKHYLM